MSTILFDHIAIGVPRIADTTPFLVGELGGEPLGGNPAGEFRFYQWGFAGGGRLEILEPLGTAGGFMHRFLAARGPGVHHVTFSVPDLADVCARAERLGYPFVGRDDSDPYYREAFLHPKQAQGIVVQFSESHARPEGRASRPESSWRDDPEPPSPPRASPPVELLGLRLEARDQERARTQWGELLRGEVEERDGVLVFRWPGSPLRLVVEVAPQRPEGPLHLELRTVRPRALALGPHPVLGARFVWVAE